jgi:hypothetical protein
MGRLLVAVCGRRSSRYRADMRHWTWWFGLSLGCLLIAAGIAETVRLLSTGDGGLWFWFPTLVGGGALIVTGTLVLPRLPGLGCLLTCLGCLLGLLPTLWTLIVPVLLVALAIVSAKQAGTSQAGDAKRS